MKSGQVLINDDDLFEIKSPQNAEHILLYQLLDIINSTLQDLDHLASSKTYQGFTVAAIKNKLHLSELSQLQNALKNVKKNLMLAVNTNFNNKITPILLENFSKLETINFSELNNISKPLVKLFKETVARCPGIFSDTILTEKACHVKETFLSDILESRKIIKQSLDLGSLEIELKIIEDALFSKIKYLQNQQKNIEEIKEYSSSIKNYIFSLNRDKDKLENTATFAQKVTEWRKVKKDFSQEECGFYLGYNHCRDCYHIKTVEEPVAFVADHEARAQAKKDLALVKEELASNELRYLEITRDQQQKLFKIAQDLKIDDLNSLPKLIHSLKAKQKWLSEINIDFTSNKWGNLPSIATSEEFLMHLKTICDFVQCKYNRLLELMKQIQLPKIVVSNINDVPENTHTFKTPKETADDKKEEKNPLLIIRSNSTNGTSTLFNQLSVISDDDFEKEKFSNSNKTSPSKPRFTSLYEKQGSQLPKPPDEKRRHEMQQKHEQVKLL